MDIIPKSPEISPSRENRGSLSLGNMSEFARKDVVCVEASETLCDAMERMADNHIGSVIVVDSLESSRRPVGIITDRDIALAFAEEEEDVSELPVSHCMSRDLITAKVDDDVFSVIETLKLNGVGRVPLVNENGELVGIVTAKNLLQKLVQGINDLLFVTDDQQKQNELFDQKH